MAYHLHRKEKCSVISSLAEGNSIRSIERMTGVHRDTIMRLGVRVGEACTEFMKKRMRGLRCSEIQVDEIWGFVGKKERNVSSEENGDALGDQYTFVALDRDTKLVPCFMVGRRDEANTRNFIYDLSNRIDTRIQLSTDAFIPYRDAVESHFGCDIDYGQVIKNLPYPTRTDRKYSPPSSCRPTLIKVMGNPDPKKICTSHVEAQNLTMRMHIRRLTRLTNAFSKKLENFKAAVGLHFGYYNYVMTHSSLKCTPAMAAGIEKSYWTVDDLVGLSEK